MNIAIFGATGATGTILTKQCLAAGFAVKVLARDPRSFPLAGYVESIRGDAKDLDCVRETVTGADVVFNALGARSLRREDVLEVAVPLIVRAMQEQGVRRIIALGSSGALPTALDQQPAYQRWLVENILYKTLLKWPIASQRAQYAALSTSGLDWTMVMPPRLVNAPAHGTYQVDGNALPRNATQISRADVADFMMKQIEDQMWVRKGVYLAW